ncbi:regulator of O-antigen component of lipopolysaccharide chain length [Pseudomonas sp. R1-43-08]|uniref:GNVR domain-containing protein n=1 Tax=Pseudomonas sp. R1-43-08 TaxID=1173270 RepID=UPI000F562108|nr:GNVR domain-containing protein [Pseudomonas sp. R1-43-08]AZF41732.1 regulator of O-antigen component of lipopolysaccharide chain length [Pseudomonas sp. R1-43-08]
MSSSFRAPPVLSPREIDFISLMQSALRQKKLFLITTLSIGVIAAGYAFFSTPEYQVSSVLRPVAINELDALNRSEIYQLPPGEALIKVGAALESYDTRLGFFRTHQTMFKRFERPGRTLEQSFEEFNRDSINLVLPDSKANLLSAYIKIEMKYPAGVDGVSILNEFVKYAIASERVQIAADVSVIVNNRLREIDGKLAAARSSYEADKTLRIASLVESDDLKRAQLQDELKALRAQLKALRSDRIAQLNEAIAISKSLGIRKPTTPSSLGDSNRTDSARVMRTEINNQQIPLYFMGSDALEAERAALAKRNTDDFADPRVAQIAREMRLLQSNREIEMLNRREQEDLFLSGVQPLRSEIARLRNLNIDMNNVNLVTIDRQALEPLGPVKPNKPLVIALGLFAGLLLGIGIFLIRYFIKARSGVVPAVSAFRSTPSHQETISISSRRVD